MQRTACWLDWGRVFLALCIVMAPLGKAQGDADQPIRDGDSLYYPEGAAIPRSVTDVEQTFLDDHPLYLYGNGSAVPMGAIHCSAEYEPMAGIVMAWEGPTAWTNILSQMIVHITTLGDADAYVMVDNAAEQSQVSSALSLAGADMGRTHFGITTTDSIWLRDYGPRYIYQGQCRAIVDHTYNRPRPNDNAQPEFFASFMGHARYEIPLVHGGGNYHLNALGTSHATRLINNENGGLSEGAIHDIWLAYQNVDTIFYDPFPTWVDATQHIDMWMQVISDDAVILSDWPMNVGSEQDRICDDAAADYAAAGYEVHRVPGRSVGGTHYTYTNVVMCNDIVLVPTYTNPSVSGHNSEALAVWEAALPDKTILPINCEGIVSAAGVMHCIVMHMPVPMGGVNPTAFLVYPRGGEAVEPRRRTIVRWASDDDVGVETVDILLSLDGGATYPITLASDLANVGRYNWIVPGYAATRARLRVVVHDADQHTGFDESEADFTITGIVGDADGNGDVELLDYASWPDCVTGPNMGPYGAGCEAFDADLDLDIDLTDFLAFQFALAP